MGERASVCERQNNKNKNKAIAVVFFFCFFSVAFGVGFLCRSPTNARKNCTQWHCHMVWGLLVCEQHGKLSSTGKTFFWPKPQTRAHVHNNCQTNKQPETQLPPTTSLPCFSSPAALPLSLTHTNSTTSNHEPCEYKPICALISRTHAPARTTHNAPVLVAVITLCHDR